MLKKAILIASYSIRQAVVSPRIICLLILMITFIGKDVVAVGNFAHETGVKTNPLIFPFLSSSWLIQLVLFAGIIFLFSDAPFINKNQPYVIIRSKRTSWVLGQIVYVIMASAIYFLILMGVSILILLPNANFTTDGWGKIVNTLAQNQMSIDNLSFGFAEKITTYYSPFEALSISFLINWGAAVFLGLILFFMNLKLNRAIGFTISAVLLFFDLLVTNALPVSFYHYSPVSLSRLVVLDPVGVSAFPSTRYPFFFFGIGIVILSVLLVVGIKNEPIEITSEI